MRKIYILPSLLTTGNFFCGIFGLTFVLNGQYPYAAVLCLVAMLFDFVDGQVARVRKASTRFGIEYDSLADMLSFGILPTFLAYSMVLKNIERIGLGIAFLYAVCCALRLARYNSQLYKEERRSFTGMPTPASAGLICSLIVLAGRYEIMGLLKALPFLMLALAYLMVSTIRYPAFQGAHPKQKKPFLKLVGIVITATVVVAYPEITFFLLFAAYASSGILAHYRFRKCFSYIRSVLLTSALPEDNEIS
jgi:CDP-diacylglycerol--serine O-phosphatidyltransferase